jgi:predicted nucleic acid-binding Zn ribbon protein
MSEFHCDLSPYLACDEQNSFSATRTLSTLGKAIKCDTANECGAIINEETSRKRRAAKKQLSSFIILYSILRWTKVLLDCSFHLVPLPSEAVP